MADQIVHIAKSKFEAQEHDKGCSRPQEEVGYGMAGGGFGVYGYCPECSAILWKTEDHGE